MEYTQREIGKKLIIRNTYVFDSIGSFSSVINITNVMTLIIKLLAYIALIYYSILYIHTYICNISAFGECV